MPRGILEFKLPEEREEFQMAQNGGKMSCILLDISQYVRSLRKYEERDSVPREEIIDKLDELLLDYYTMENQ